jgi:hypothetical protein
MSAILPIGYVNLVEAAQAVEHALFAGEPNRLEVIQARVTLGHDVGDGAASAKAITAIWEAVDEGALRLVAIGGRPRKIIKLDSDFTLGVPLLRRVWSFTYLRPSHREWKQVTAWFGTDLSDVALAIRETELHALAQRLGRGRRRKGLRKADTKAGRPSDQQSVQRAIEDIIKRKQWSTKRAIKELTLLVNRSQGMRKSVSQDTVGRALDSLFENTRDRRYARPPRSLTDN